MKADQRFTVTGSLASGRAVPLYVPEAMISEVGSYGDIVMLGKEGAPAQDWRTGIPVPHDQKFILTKPE